MKRHHLCLIVVTLAALVTGCTIGQQERKYRLFFSETAQALVPGYRLPDESEYGPLWAIVEGQGWETHDGSGETKAEFWTSGDFNDDETLDYAYILVEDASGTRALFAFLSTANGYEAERLDAEFDWGIWLRTRSPGRYVSAVGPDSPQFEVENQAIDFFQFEGASSTFVWNRTTQSFDRFRTSD
jgi:hypothetical protein